MPSADLGTIGLGSARIIIGRPDEPAAFPEHPQVGVDAVEVSPGYSSEVARRVLSRHVAKLSACTARGPLPPGALTVSIQLLDDGRVRSVRARSPAALANAARCIEGRLLGVVFPAPERAQAQPVRIDALLAIGEEGAASCGSLEHCAEDGPPAECTSGS